MLRPLRFELNEKDGGPDRQARRLSKQNAIDPTGAYTGGAMKVLAVSDQVNDFLYSESIKTQLGDVDLVLSCGDLAYPYLEYILTVLDVPLLYVRGNHDNEYALNETIVLKRPRGARHADGKVIAVQTAAGEELLVAGLEGSKCRGHHQLSERQMKRRLRRLTPRLIWNRWCKGRALDVLIAHAPPLGIHDGHDPCHRGYETFLRLMDRYRPRYLIHGHTHPASGYDGKTRRYGQTTVVNVYGYKVLELDVDSGKRQPLCAG